ncbi:energy transducer TonB [Flavobacterium sp. SM15]|uniref:energy transducer TonB n=1 Tax=Flavobacterium sp. SM15 TaxID=2908005 RepID=UPI001EDB4F8B|nr:energy transducer TonB [Flavobacterium sp. SM15]MCG2611180.1 energy transducer TonB [Flavobacterium sp. SM15]
MSKINIYETGWLNMVFEGRNKTYGAYQLRTENPKTTIRALFSALALFTSAAAIPMIINYLKPSEVAILTNKPLDGDIVLVDTKLFKKEEPKKEERAPETNKPLKEEKVIRHTAMKPVKREEAVQEVTTNKELENAQIGRENQEGTNTTGNAIVVTTNTNTTGGGNSGSTIETPISLEVQPTYPGGIGEFLKDVSRKFKTPEMEEESATLKVMVYFVIERDGTLSNIKVTRDPGHNLGKEALRVLNSMKTKWTPGYKNGEPVRTAYNLPIVVNIK